ncbi:hypothetical protein HPB47_015127, partial [Ixodes persulcatus]
TIKDNPPGKEDDRCALWNTYMRCNEPRRYYWRFDGKRCVQVWNNNMCNTRNVHAS